jgi:hypothetical protein
MVSSNMLLILVILLLSVTFYSIFTSKVTAEERDEMIDSEDMFP